MKPEVRNAIGLAAMTLLMAAAVVFVRLQAAAHILPEESKEISAQRKSADNAYYVLRTAHDMMANVRVTPEPVSSESKPQRPGETNRESADADDEHITGAFDRYAAAIDAACRALDKPFYLYPEIPRLRADTPRRADFRGLAHVLSERASRRAESGEVEQAFVDLLDALQLGRLAASDGPLSAYLMGRDMQADALERIPDIARETPRRELLDAALEDLSDLCAAELPAESVLDFEWRMLDNSLGLGPETETRARHHRRGLRVFGERLTFTWRVKRGQRFLIRHRADLRGKMTISYRAYREWERDRPEMAAADHPLWDVCGTLDEIQACHASMQTWVSGARIALALELYRMDLGAYPATLDASAEYLGTIPADPFTDAPFVYRANGGDYVLYSLGENGADDGGTEGDDLAIRRKEDQP